MKIAFPQKGLGYSLPNQTGQTLPEIRKRGPQFLVAWLIISLCLILTGQGAAAPFSVVHTFTGSDGIEPLGGLTGIGNTLYGTTEGGGNQGSGTVFTVNTDGSSFSTLYNFTERDNKYDNSDGAIPCDSLSLEHNTLYGTTENGGSWELGTVFAVTINGGSFTNLHNFSGDGTNGADSLAGLVLSGNILYGTTDRGGASDNGTVFAVNTDGTDYTNLHSFTGTPYPITTNSDGALPVGGLALSGSTLYGTAGYGGAFGFGTVFKLNTDGTGFTTLYDFTGGSDGAKPYGGLILSGSTLYGTALAGGTSGNGTVFAVSTNGTGFTDLHEFTATFGSFATNADGASPAAGLIVSGGTLYGTTEYGGGFGNGTVFAVNTDGTDFTTFHTFTATLYPNLTNCDGSSPFGGLLLLHNTLYGTTQNGGGSRYGTVFSLSLPPVSQPQLDIAFSGTNVVLTWTNAVSGFILQSATNLNAAVWSTNFRAPNVVSGLYTVTNPISNTQQFFRLASP
jgi:uncharacterized repeat protein (TIGR03803 family)